MASILEDVQTSAAAVSQALLVFGYAANFSADSLIEIDRFFDENSRDGEPTAEGLLAEELGKRLFAIGSYVGEVLRRTRGGEWIGDDADPRAEVNVILRLADGTKCWPIQRVMKRFNQGPAESIAIYGLGAGLEYSRPIGPLFPAERIVQAKLAVPIQKTEALAKKRFWKFW